MSTESLPAQPTCWTDDDARWYACKRCEVLWRPSESKHCWCCERKGIPMEKLSFYTRRNNTEDNV